jgi:hypothetical protein
VRRTGIDRAAASRLGVISMQGDLAALARWSGRAPTGVYDVPAGSLAPWTRSSAHPGSAKLESKVVAGTTIFSGAL